MRNITFVIRLSVELHRPDIPILPAHPMRKNRKGFAIGQPHPYLRIQRRTYFILTANRIYRIESHGAEYIPGRHLPAILITAQAGGRILIQLTHHLRRILLGFPGLPHFVEQINNMMARFIAMRILEY